MKFRGDRLGAVRELESAVEETAVSVASPLAVMNSKIHLNLALAGLGFTLVLEFMLRDQLTSGRLVRCLPGFRAKPDPVF